MPPGVTATGATRNASLAPYEGNNLKAWRNRTKEHPHKPRESTLLGAPQSPKRAAMAMTMTMRVSLTVAPADPPAKR